MPLVLKTPIALWLQTYLVVRVCGLEGAEIMTEILLRPNWLYWHTIVKTVAYNIVATFAAINSDHIMACR